MNVPFSFSEPVQFRPPPVNPTIRVVDAFPRPKPVARSARRDPAASVAAKRPSKARSPSDIILMHL